MVITQESAHSLAALNRAVAVDVRTSGERQDIALPLVVPLGMEMSDIFAQGSPQRALAKEDHLGLSVIECFETDGGVNYGSDRLILF